MPYISQEQFFKKLAEKYDREKTLTTDRIADMMAYRAAMLLISEGMEDEEFSYDTEQLERYAAAMKKAGIGEEARKLYGEAKEAPSAKELNVKPFLYVLSMDPPEIETKFGEEIPSWDATQNALRSAIIYAEDEEKTARELWWGTINNKYNQEVLDEPYSEEDAFVYEYNGKVPEYPRGDDSVFRYPHLILTERLGRGAETHVDVERFFRENPIDELNLRNKLTVEKLKRGDEKRVCEARDKVEASFTFRDDGDLEQAKQNAAAVLASMRAQTGKATKSPQWRKLMDAVKGFVNAPDMATAADRSAEVLLATENFTKGRKSRWQRSSTLECVDLALGALAASVPDAPHNPCIQPLVNRFNTVRGSWHPVQLRDYELGSAEKAMSFEEKRLQKQSGMLLQKARAGQPIAQEEATQALAALLALKEHGEEPLSPTDLARRAEELSQDNIVHQMAQRLDDPAVLESYAQKGQVERMGYHAASRFEEISAGLEQQEALFRSEAEELTMDYHLISDDYDPEREQEAFAKLIAYGETMQKMGKHTYVDGQAYLKLDNRVEELKKDPKVTELMKSLVGRKELNRFGKNAEDPLDLAGELSKLYNGKLTVEQWKEQQKGAKQKQEQEPEKEQGPEQGQEKAAEDEVVYLRPEAYNRVFKNKPQMMDTSKVFASMNKDSAQLAANMKTALKTQNGVELRREMSDCFRKLVAVYKAGGNLNSIPDRINVKKLPEKYQKMKNDPSIDKITDAVMTDRDNFNLVMQTAEKGADELRKIVLSAYVRSVRQLQEQAEKQAQASKQKKTEKQMNQPAEQRIEKEQKSKTTEQQAQTGKQKKTEDQPTR